MTEPTPPPPMRYPASHVEHALEAVERCASTFHDAVVLAAEVRLLRSVRSYDFRDCVFLAAISGSAAKVVEGYSQASESTEARILESANRMANEAVRRTERWRREAT